MANSGTFVYVSNADTRDIQVFSLAPLNGDLTLVQRAELSGAGSLNPLAVSPDRRFLYGAQREAPFQVSCFAVDREEP